MQFTNSLLFTFVLLICSCPPSLIAQVCTEGPQVLTFHSDVDDTEQPYGIYLPKNFDQEKKYPLVMMLHGAGSNHRLALRRVFGKSNEEGQTDVEASRYFPAWKDRQFIVATPYARGTMGYQGIAEKDVMDVLADVNERFNIDENRTYLTGLSMGGGGTLWIGLNHPDCWAAIAPVCPAPPAGTEKRAGNALNFPVKIFQGGADPVVKPEAVREWVQTFKDEGVEVEYVEYPGVQHDSWVPAYADGQIFDWFEQFERNPFPDQVRFSTREYRHNKAYWIEIKNMKAGKLAEIDARFTAPNRITIVTDDIIGFDLNLKGHPKFDPDQKLVIQVNKDDLFSQGVSQLAISRLDDKWELEPARSPILNKNSTTEGPMLDVLADRHIYVYGTADNPDKETLERRRKQAEQAANWSFYRGEFLGRIHIYPRVLSDQEVRPSDREESNLVLFGTTDNNKIINEFEEYLPFHLKDSLDHYGLAYVFPVRNRYVLVNSGISIMDAPEGSKEIDGLTRFASPPMMLALKKFDDFVFYSKEEVLVSDFYDEQWQLKPKVSRKLAKYPVLEVNR